MTCVIICYDLWADGKLANIQMIMEKSQMGRIYALSISYITLTPYYSNLNNKVFWLPQSLWLPLLPNKHLKF